MKNKALIISSLTLLTGGFFNNLNAQTTREDASAVYNQLQHIYIKGPRLTILNDLEVNAYTNTTDIEITQGMLKFARNRAELALVLGHELTHFKNGDYSSMYNSPSTEYRCDYWGSYYAQQLGYNHCLSDKMFLRMYQQYGNNGGWFSGHPGNLNRYNRLNKGCQ